MPADCGHDHVYVCSFEGCNNTALAGHAEPHPGPVIENVHWMCPEHYYDYLMSAIRIIPAQRMLIEIFNRAGDLMMEIPDEDR